MSNNIFSMEAKISHDCAIAYRARAASQLEKMQEGPHIDAATIIIPSEWYHEEAACFWRAIGCVWCPGHPSGQAWVLHYETARYNGRRWTADQWLSSIQRKYRELWPELERRAFCVSCGQEFYPWHPKQRWCDDCTA